MSPPGNESPVRSEEPHRTPPRIDRAGVTVDPLRPGPNELRLTGLVRSGFSVSLCVGYDGYATWLRAEYISSQSTSCFPFRPCFLSPENAVNTRRSLFRDLRCARMAQDGRGAPVWGYDTCLWEKGGKPAVKCRLTNV